MRGTSIGRVQSIDLHLMGAFALWVDDVRVHLGRREERLLAFLGTRGPCHRPSVAGTLWPNSDEPRALSSLRAAVLKARRAAPDVLDVDGSTLDLRPGVRVDLRDFVDIADGVAHRNGSEAPQTERLLGTEELLPGWYDDWVLFERERLLHRRIRALEVLAVQALEGGQPDLALTAARDAVSLEPLRESACRLLIRAHMALGNRALAASVFADYRRDLARELGIEPSPQIIQEVRDGLAREKSGVRQGSLHSRG